MVEPFVRRPARLRHIAVDLSRRDRLEQRPRLRAVGPGNEEHALGLWMERMGAAEKLEPGHRGHLARREERDDLDTVPTMELLQTLQPGFRRRFAEDFVVGGVPSDKLAPERLQHVRLLVNRDQQSLHGTDSSPLRRKEPY